MEGTLSVFGDHSTGEAIRSQNVMAAASIANIVKSSLGPVGLDKMLVDDIGDWNPQFPSNQQDMTEVACHFYGYQCSSKHHLVHRVAPETLAGLI
uniref:Uncharacterized protein n=1 Tax=Sciurus vulgaris TaxID=55149 RepID=A0A8D2CNU9_SCIVU